MRFYNHQHPFCCGVDFSIYGHQIASRNTKNATITHEVSAASTDSIPTTVVATAAVGPAFREYTYADVRHPVSISNTACPPNRKNRVMKWSAANPIVAYAIHIDNAPGMSAASATTVVDSELELAG